MRPIQILLILLCLPVTASAIVLKGHVFIDKNRNGIYDANDTGVKDAIVSDQALTTLTNSEGYYEFESKINFGIIFLIQPSGYKIINTFWKKIPEQQQEFIADFPVIPLPNTTRFTFIHASDPHLSPESLDRFQKFRHQVDSIVPAFVLMSGDLVKDALRISETEATSYYELYAQEITKFKVPVYSIPGNHEIFGIERDASRVEPSHPLYGKKMYRHHLGPDYYSFNYGGIHFIGLNSVDYDDLWYYGHVDSVQLQWLEKDIKLSRRMTPVVTFSHIPFFTAGLSLWGYQDGEPGSTLINLDHKKQFRHVVDNAGTIMDYMKNNVFPLALSGHFHAEQKLSFYGKPTRFNQAAALVGNGTMSGMTLPSGFTLYTVTNGIINEGEFIPLR
jgi:predicted MPP superfamily phosphohydrolase